MEKGIAMSVDNLLSRLEKVKRHGHGKYMCRCPAHNDKTASLTVTDNGDGRILINCFAGCDTYTVLRSVGLDWQDVMPENYLGHNVKPVPKLLYPSEALELIKRECMIITLCAMDISKGRFLKDDEMERMKQAMQFIHKAIEATKNETH